MKQDTKTIAKQPKNFPNSPQNHPTEGFRGGLGVFGGFWGGFEGFWDPVGCNSQTSSGKSNTIFGGRAEDPALRTRVFNAYPKTNQNV